MSYHDPALLTESIDGLNITPKGSYADMTLGGAGHAREILKRLGRKGRLYVFDQDVDAKANLPDDSRVVFIHANFRYLKHFVRYLNIQGLDGIIADLGISSHQIDEVGRGFAFRQNTPLDMRMNSGSVMTAARVLNEYEPEKLTKVFRDYGEIRGAHRIVKRLIIKRKEKPLDFSNDLIYAIEDLLPVNQRNKMLARIFQALRIEVNDEIGALRELLSQMEDVLKPKGRMVILSYHSIEDRMVKNLIKTGNIEGRVVKDFYGNQEVVFNPLHKGVIVAGEEEINRNPRARSAKLRIAEKI